MSTMPQPDQIDSRTTNTPSDQPAVSIDGVGVRFRTKRADVVALRDISLEIPARQFVTIVGPSGCGKSTLLKLVAGLVKPTEGSITMRGQKVTSPRSDIGFVFQRAALLEWRNVRRNITLQGEMRGLSKRETALRTDKLIEMTGLKGFEDAMPYELSGGMQQRVSLCRALLHQPPVLLMDEPFGALDALTREDMNVELQRIWQETRTTVLLVTHSVAEAVYLANRVVIMSARPGRVLEIMDVDLPDNRDYSATMASPEFGARTARIRSLLGARTAAD